jgi:hypothetical protein
MFGQTWDAGQETRAQLGMIVALTLSVNPR